MRFNIESKLLLSNLSAVSKVVSSKNAISILDNFLFSLEGSNLVITGSDQETTLTTTVPVADAEGGGKFAANVKVLLNLLKELPDQGLTFDINDANLEININYMNGRFNFIGINGNEFPTKEVSMEEETVSFVLPAERLRSGLQHTVFAVGSEALRPQMMGVFCDIKPEEVVFVASDTHKLVRYRELNVNIGFERSFILPTKPATVLASILEKKEGDVKITVDTKSATFEADTFVMTCRFVNGRYPNYNSVIPPNNDHVVSIDRITLLNALRRVSVFASSGGLVRMELKENEIFLSTQDIDFSTSAEEKVMCEYQGNEMVIGFNDENIIDVINNIDCDVLNIRLLDPSRAGIFVPSVQKPDEDLLVLLMPMMI